MSRLDELEAENARLQAELATAYASRNSIAEQLNRAEAENARLREALKRSATIVVEPAQFARDALEGGG
jgi:predicted nuclease with TOPRIM domain